MFASRTFVCSLLLLVGGGSRVAGQGLLAGLSALLQDCPQRSAPTRLSQSSFQALAHCARRRALAAVDRILEDESIPLLDGLELVAANSSSQLDASRTANLRDLLKRIREEEAAAAGAEGGGGGGGQEWQAARLQQQQAERGDWSAELIKRLARVLKTHVIKIDLERTTGVTSNSQSNRVESRGRRRRRRQMQMMPIVMMGVLLMGSVLIPMGFQFLAVLGGKALILAKMALMLSSIQGLKKIATNGVNYGLYHSPVVPEAPWHERNIELPASYSHLAAAASYPGSPGAGYSHSPTTYLEPATTYLTNRRSAST